MIHHKHRFDSIANVVQVGPVMDPESHSEDGESDLLLEVCVCLFPSQASSYDGVG